TRFFLKLVSSRDSSGRFTHSERSATIKRGNTELNYGLILSEEYIYDGGLLEQVLCTEYGPAPGKQILHESKLVFIYD
ncbi:MAG TPA: hypothetical protein VI112_11390, partial [Bacteroidia bacterium]